MKAARSSLPAEPEVPAGISAAQVEEQLRRILASERFAHSERLRRFLQYVVEETLAGRGDKLKEYSLGVAVFNRDASYDPRTDPIVRVEAVRLRARLSEYYSSQGSDDPLIIELPRGSYTTTVRWRSAGQESQIAQLRRWRWIRNASIAAALVMAALSTALFLQNRSLREEAAALPPPLVAADRSPIWGPILASPADVAIVFGSPLFFENEQKRFYLRQYDVNDPVNRFKLPEFQTLDRLLGPLSEPRYMYAQMGDVYCLHQLGAFLGRHGKQTRAIPAFQANWDAIKNSNLIVIGPARMNPILERLPIQLDFEFQPDFYVTNRRPQPGEKTSYWTPSHRDALSYGVIASAPGLAPNREILVFTSHASAGTRGAVEYLTGPATLRELTARLNHRPGERRNYQILLRVLADHEQAYRTEYVTHHSSERAVTKP
jgi:hypothetical protein